MNGLLYKESTLLLNSFRKNLVLLLLFYAVLAFASDMPFLLFAVIFLAGYYPLGSLSFDEQCRFDAFARTLPVRDEVVLGSKYCTVLLWLAAGTVPAGALLALMSLLRGTLTLPEALCGCLCSWCVLLFTSAFMIPISLKLGSARARSGMMVCFVLIFGGAALLGRVIPMPAALETGLDSLTPGRLAGLLLLALAACLALFAVSFFVSTRIRRAKEY